MSLNLEEIIIGCKQNDRKDQGLLYTSYKNILFGICLKYSRNTSDAEDILQESFITIFKKINSYKGVGSFEGWIKRITINKSLDFYRQKKMVFVEEDNIPDEIMEVDDLSSYSLSFLLGLIQNLPDRYRLIFNLYELDGYTHSEIANMLNISIGTSKSNLHRAKLNLKKALKNQSQQKINGQQ